MQQKLNAKEFIERCKMLRINQPPSNVASIDVAKEKNAANDAGVPEKMDIKSMSAIGKKQHRTMKELLTESRERKQRSELRKSMATKMLESDEALEKTQVNSDESEVVLANNVGEQNFTFAQQVDDEQQEMLHRPAVPVGNLLNVERRYPIESFGSLAPVLRLIARAVQVDAEMVGSSLLGVTSALAQGLINVSVDADGRTGPTTLNMFVIAASGERKSSTINVIAKPLYAAIKQAYDERQSMIVQDVTVDGLIVGLINRCPSQLLLTLEGASLLGGHAMSPDNVQRFFGTASQLFSGEHISRTRVGGHQQAYDRRLSVLLFAQPIVAMEFLSSELFMQQGIGNRFLYSQPPSLVGTRMYAQVPLETDPLYQHYCAKITGLASHPWKINPATGGMDTRNVSMSAGAKAAWATLHNELEIAAGQGQAFASHAGYVARFSEQVQRIAALLAILEDQEVQQISENIMLRAIDLGDYYLQSALHLFNVAPANKDEADAKALLDWMQNKREELDLQAIPVRMMYKDGPRCARPSKRTKELLTLLLARGDVTEFTKTIVYGDGKRSSDNYSVTGT